MLLAASLACCAGTLAGAELALRRLNPSRLDAMSVLLEYSEVYGWTPRPNAQFLDGGHPATINAKGYRGRLVPPDAPIGVKRVVMLGDSVAFGISVGDDQTFSYLLDRPQDGVEVVNLAVPGYGLDQDLLKLQHEALGEAPALVVLNVCLDNDFADICLPTFLYDSHHPKPYFRIEAGQLVLHTDHLRRPWHALLADSLRRRSHLFDWLTSRTHTEAEGEPSEHWTARKERALQGGDAKELGFRLIVRMRELAHQRGGDLCVVIHPNKAAYDRGSPWIDAFLWSPLLNGVAVIDMRHEYLARGMSWRQIALDGIGHLSPAGHRAAAEILHDRLSQDMLSTHRAAR